MGEKIHRSAINAMDAHDAEADTGCIIRCEPTYVEGNTHSHRWNAAEQARSESRVNYGNITSTKGIDTWDQAKIDALRRLGGVAGPTGASSRGRTEFQLKPFYRDFHPFKHNAHHIIPMGVVWKCIDKVKAKAAPNGSRMFDLVIGAILEEPYNINAQVNMILLPTEQEIAMELGLPEHCEGNQRQHKKYQTMASKKVKAKFVKKYRSLADAVAAEQHPKEQKVPDIRSMMEAISKALYEAIIAVSIATRGQAVSLDGLKREIGRLANRRLSR
jgi:hypothetical protein